MVLEYKKKKSNRPDEIVYLVSSSNRQRASRIDEGMGFKREVALDYKVLI